jgi:hypothetical protein
MKPNFTGIHPDQCSEIEIFHIRPNFKKCFYLCEVPIIGKFLQSYHSAEEIYCNTFYFVLFFQYIDVQIDRSAW